MDPTVDKLGPKFESYEARELLFPLLKDAVRFEFGSRCFLRCDVALGCKNMPVLFRKALASGRFFAH